MNRKAETIEAVVSELVWNSRSLGETLLRKHMVEDDIWVLKRNIHTVRKSEIPKDELTALVGQYKKDQRLLTREERELSRTVSGLRTAIEVARRKLVSQNLLPH